MACFVSRANTTDFVLNGADNKLLNAFQSLQEVHWKSHVGMHNQCIQMLKRKWRWLKLIIKLSLALSMKAVLGEEWMGNY